MANETKISSAIRETLTGSRVGLVLSADAISVVREELKGHRVGKNVMGDAISVVRETVAGQRLGRNVAADAISVIREVLIAEPPIRVVSAVRESLISLPNDPLTQARLVPGYRQAVVMVRPKMALPSTVKSPQIVPSLRQQVVRQVEREWARSGIYAATLRMQSVVARNVLPANDMNSFATVAVFVEQVVRSRGQTYVPVSAVFVRAQRQLVVSTRVVTRAPDVRTAITVGSQRQQIVVSRKTAVVVIMTEAHAATLVQQAVVEDTRPAPRSEIRARTLFHMTVQKHTVVPPGIDDRVGGLREQVMIARVPTAPFGVEFARTLVAQAIVGRPAVMHESHAIVGKHVELTVMRRITYAPAFVVGRHVSSLSAQVVMKRVTIMEHGFIEVGSMRMAFTLRRIVPAPWDVIDPSIGRHAATLHMLSVHRRTTTPPAVISKESRYVFNLAQQSVLGDVFDAPPVPQPVEQETLVYQVAHQVVHRDREWGPVSAVKVIELAASLVVGDNGGWIDPFLPTSDVTVFTAHQAIALGDVFPDSMMVQSAAEVAMLGQVFAVGDGTMPDPMLPLSEIQASGVLEMAAVGDAQFADPTIPLSEVRSSLVASPVAVRDPSLSGSFGMSEIKATSVLEFLLIRDRSLVGIPLRQGPRPVVSVSMS